jgi:hypothetical protein
MPSFQRIATNCKKLGIKFNKTGISVKRPSFMGVFDFHTLIFVGKTTHRA